MRACIRNHACAEANSSRLWRRRARGRITMTLSCSCSSNIERSSHSRRTSIYSMHATLSSMEVLKSHAIHWSRLIGRRSATTRSGKASSNAAGISATCAGSLSWRALRVISIGCQLRSRYRANSSRSISISCRSPWESRSMHRSPKAGRTWRTASWRMRSASSPVSSFRCWRSHGQTCAIGSVLTLGRGA